jgi:hypothetical protein
MSLSPNSIKIKKITNDSKSTETGRIKVTRILSLDKVIQEISSDAVKTTRETIKNTSKKIVIFNTKTKEAVLKTSIFVFQKHYKYYLVSTQDSARGKTEYEIKNLSSPNTTIVISYDIKCELGKEETLVKTLYSDHSTSDTLNLLIKRYVQVFIADLKKDSINPEKEFDGYKNKLTGELKEYLSNQVGLQADIVLSLKWDDLLKDITLNLEPFKIRVMDYNEPLDLEVDAGLDVDHSNKSAAIPYISREDRLKDFITDQIKKYVLENNTLHQYVYQFNSTVKSELMERLERALKSKGRRLAWLQLKSKINFDPPKRSVDVDYSVLCNISDYSQKIEVEHKLILQLSDLALFKTNCTSASLEEWVEERLAAITKDQMINQRYVDILLDFAEEDTKKQQILGNIKKEMQDQARTIGCTVKHLIVQPDMKPLTIFKNGFMLRIEEESFSTFIKRVSVKLDIVVTGKLSDLRKLHRYITPDKDIVKEMDRVVLEETEKLMHKADPGEFYMPSKDPEAQTVEKKLNNAILNALEEQFYANDIGVVIKIVETDLIKRIMDLVNGSPYHIKVGIMPLAGGGAQEFINFEIEFLIRSVSNWHTFIFKNYDPETHEEIKKIKEALEKDIKSRFMTVPYDVLKFPDIEGSYVVLKVARKSHSKIAHIFGLDIFISNVTRSRTMTEIARQKVLAVKVAEQIKKEKAIIKKDMETQTEIHDKMQDFIRENTTPLDEEMAELGGNKELDHALEKVDEIKAKNLSIGVEEAAREQLAPPGGAAAWSPDDYKDEFSEDSPDGSAEKDDKKKLAGKRRSKS